MRQEESASSGSSYWRRFAKMSSKSFRGDLPVTIANSMEDAVSLAFDYAVRFRADVVLSPACASFDWYSNYVERGGRI